MSSSSAASGSKRTRSAPNGAASTPGQISHQVRRHSTCRQTSGTAESEATSASSTLIVMPSSGP